MSSEIPPIPKRRPDVFTPIYRVISLILLAGIGVILFFGLIQRSPLTPECKSALAKAELVIATQADVIKQLAPNYEQSVYGDSTVTTVTQQIFRAGEFEFNALQIITLQNAALLEISATCH